MGLIAGMLEEAGMTTVVLSSLEAVTEKVAPPRWLALPFPLGYPLGEPGDAERQRKVLRAGLELARNDEGGSIRW